MGKTQSKRSVDITTDPKKGPEEEVTGKMEKIEDVDQKELNGDATNQEKNDAEKKDSEECENDKDLTTEKNAAAGDATEQNSTAAANTTVTSTSNDAEANDAAAASKESGAVVEEISPLADDSAKKTKKDKVKKKWSFRSISFGKKDKQKPAKTEETNEAAAATADATAAATNGDAEKPAAEGEVAEKKDEGAGGDAKTVENGESSKTEEKLNGEATPTEVKSTEAAVSNETTAAAAATDGTNDNQTETKSAAIETTAAAVATTTVVTPPAEVVSNGTVEDAAKNGDAHDNDADAGAISNNVPEIASDSNKSIPSVDEKPHQNGTNGDDMHEVETEQAEQLKATIKSQIEVNTITATTNITTMNIVDNSADKKQLEIISQEPPNLSTTTISSKSIETNSNSSSIPLNDQQIQTIAFIQEKHIQNKTEIVETSISTATIPVTTTSPPSSPLTTTSTTISDTTNTTIVDKDITTNTESDNVDPKEINDITSHPLNVDENVQLISDHKEETVISESQLPPPLPISPPPSQMSVFAFKNTETIPLDENITVSEPAKELEISQVDLEKDIIDVPQAIDEVVQSPMESYAEVHEEVKEIIQETSENTEIQSESIEVSHQQNIEEKDVIVPEIELPTPVIQSEIPEESEQELSTETSAEAIITEVITQDDIIATVEVEDVAEITANASNISMQSEQEDTISNEDTSNAFNNTAVEDTSMNNCTEEEKNIEQDAQEIVEVITEKAVEILQEKEEKQLEEENKIESKEEEGESIVTVEQQTSESIVEKDVNNGEIIEEMEKVVEVVVEEDSVETKAIKVVLETSESEVRTEVLSSDVELSETLNELSSSPKEEELLAEQNQIEHIEKQNEKHIQETYAAVLLSNGNSEVKEQQMLLPSSNLNANAEIKAAVTNNDEDSQKEINVDEESKEINPKDLKENAAADSTTQKELPVACE